MRKQKTLKTTRTNSPPLKELRLLKTTMTTQFLLPTADPKAKSLQQPLIKAKPNYKGTLFPKTIEILKIEKQA